MNFFPILRGDKAPSIGFSDFVPEVNSQLINASGDAAASGEVLDHWFFADALPTWIQYIMVFAAGAAVLMIVVGGVMLMLKGADEELNSRGIKTIIWAIVGLIISALSYTIVEIINQVPITSSNPNANNIFIDDENGILGNLASGRLREDIIPQVIKIILSLVGTLALGLLLYAGSLLVFRDGDDEKITKARQLIIWSLLGVVVAVLSYAIVEAVISLQFTTEPA